VRETERIARLLEQTFEGHAYYGPIRSWRVPESLLELQKPRMTNMHRVTFITTETGKDLIVAFAVEGDDPDDIRSLILLRTPKYEFVFDDTERGVSVSYDDNRGQDRDFLEAFEVEGQTAKVVTQRREYSIDLSRVDPKELKRALRVLEKMNFDKRFILRT